MTATETAPVLLVGHSMGGITISEVAERVPDRLLGLVYVSARLIPNGQSMADARVGETSSRPGRIVSDDGISSSYKPEQAAEIFYNTTARAKIERILPRMTPQPIKPTTERLQLTPERFGRVPRAYIECPARQ